MDRRVKNFKKGIMFGVAMGLVFISYAFNTGYWPTAGKKKIKKDPKECLLQIHDEVKELGNYENEAFIKREFHTELDGNRENKEEHVVILIYKVEAKERMLLQITYFASKRKGSPVKYPRETRVILCSLKEGDLEIKNCDYTEKEIESLLPDILEGIRKKKEILKLIENKN